MATNITVAVRVRPFTQRELASNTTCIVEMEGRNTVVHPDPSKTSNHPEKDRTFTYDYSYWSHDPSSSHFVEQETVMQDLAGAILVNALDGFNGCLFAYGQTGSGKTFTLVGHRGQPGMFPWTVEHLFKEKERIEAEPDVEIKLWMSYLEVYNERIQDLLSPSNNEKTELHVMDHPKLGVYIPSLTEVPCHSADDATRAMEFGTKKRAVAATSMNAASSRSHAVFCLRLQRSEGHLPEASAEDQRQVLKSKINLIDLAGSERLQKTEARGTTLKEGASINKSLSELGRVIKELSSLHRTRSTSKVSSVPGADFHSSAMFRASKLTFLLRDSLVGNSKTYMLATISPASENHDETLSTLTFASSVKAIKTVAMKNIDKKDELIYKLKNELEELRALLDNPEQIECRRRVSIGDDGDGQDSITMSRLGSMRDEVTFSRQMTNHIKEHERHLRRLMHNRTSIINDDNEGLHISDHDRMLGTYSNDKVDKSTPYLMNMAEDPVLAGCLLYYLPAGLSVTIGSAEDNRIPLSGVGIVEKLCTIENTDNTSLTLCKNGPSGRVVVGGRPVLEDRPEQLHHGMKLFFGRAHAFKVVVPEEVGHGVEGGMTTNGLRSMRLSLDLLLDEDILDDECHAIEDSPSWVALRPALEQVPLDRKPFLVDEVKKAIKDCDEANDIAAQCRPDEYLNFKADITSLDPVSVVVCVTKGDRPLPIYVWSREEMAERLERMRGALDTFIHTGQLRLDPLENPWHQASHDEILEHISQLQKVLDHALQQNYQLQFKSKIGRTLLAWNLEGHHEEVLRLAFSAWCQLSRTVKQALDVVKVKSPLAEGRDTVTHWTERVRRVSKPALPTQQLLQQQPDAPSSASDESGGEAPTESTSVPASSMLRPRFSRAEIAPVLVGSEKETSIDMNRTLSLASQLTSVEDVSLNVQMSAQVMAQRELAAANWAQHALPQVDNRKDPEWTVETMARKEHIGINVHKQPLDTQTMGASGQGLNVMHCVSFGGAEAAIGGNQRGLVVKTLAAASAHSQSQASTPQSRSRTWSSPPQVYASADRCVCGTVFTAGANCCRTCGKLRSDILHLRNVEERVLKLEAQAVSCDCGNVFVPEIGFCQKCGKGQRELGEPIAAAGDPFANSAFAMPAGRNGHSSPWRSSTATIRVSSPKMRAWSRTTSRSSSPFGGQTYSVGVPVATTVGCPGVSLSASARSASIPRARSPFDRAASQDYNESLSGTGIGAGNICLSTGSSAHLSPGASVTSPVLPSSPRTPGRPLSLGSSVASHAASSQVPPSQAPLGYTVPQAAKAAPARHANPYVEHMVRFARSTQATQVLGPVQTLPPVTFAATASSRRSHRSVSDIDVLTAAQRAEKRS